MSNLKSLAVLTASSIFLLPALSGAWSLNVEDVVSIQSRNDRYFDVTCKNGFHDVATADDIRGDYVCNRKPILLSDCEDRTIPNGINYFACSLNPNDVSLSPMPARASPDLLWMIDDSGSMSPKQIAIATASQRFADTFLMKNVDWKMGIVTTDSNKSSRTGFSWTTDATNSNYLTEFSKAVTGLGTSGDPFEKPFDSVLNALKAQPSFLRKGSQLVVVVVTDASEQSSITSDQFLNELSALKGDSKITVHGLIGTTDLGCNDGENDGLYAGGKFEALIKSTKGTVAPLCGDISAAVENLGKTIHAGLTPLPVPQEVRIDASQVSDAATLKIYFNGKELARGAKGQGVWEYDAQFKHIVFWDSNFVTDWKKQILILF